MRAKRAKNLKFYVEILKREGHWVWTVVKNGVIGCKICVKKGVFSQADDIGQNMGMSPRGLDTISTFHFQWGHSTTRGYQACTRTHKKHPKHVFPGLKFYVPKQVYQ